MPAVQPSAPDLANRRMVLGLLLSLLAHALILSIGFGPSGLRAGGAGPITVDLASLPPPVPLPELSAAPANATPSLPHSAVTQRTPGQGFRLFGPIPMAPPTSPAQPRPAKRRRTPRPAPPRKQAAPTPVIVQQANPDAAFKVPFEEQVEAAPEEPEPEPLAAESAPVPGPDRHAAEDAAERARAEQQREAEGEGRRLARAHEAERQRLAVEQRAQGSVWRRSGPWRCSARRRRSRSSRSRQDGARKRTPGSAWQASGRLRRNRYVSP